MDQKNGQTCSGSQNLLKVGERGETWEAIP